MSIVDLRSLALKKVRITGNIIGKFGSFEIVQEYKNTTKDLLEVGYTFPIVETATVVGFEINIGDKVLKGKCKEKEEARKEYQQNLVDGNSAYLMEQDTDNVFNISIGKIQSGEEVTVKIQYIDKFEIVDNSIQVMIPTLVTPKYKSKITDNLLYGKVDYTVDFNINIDKTINRRSISCPTHTINIIDEDDSERIEVVDYDMSKDFKLSIEIKNELSSNAITSKTIDGENIVYLSFMPEILDSYEDSEKEYIFIVDVSGSMSGNKIEETKKAVIECLKQLDVGDKFNIIPFESKYKAMSMTSIEFNEHTMRDAEKYVESLVPLGGTEILSPIKFALYEKETDKIILLFTDGQVGNETEIIQFVDENIGTSRLFTFGIDSNVNSAFIKELAKVGNGKAELIHPNERIDDKIIRTFARIQTPLLEELKIDYGKSKLLNEIREEKCLFNYEFFNVFAKLDEIADDIQLKGKILDKEYVWKINKKDIKKTDVDLEVLFAKQEMDRLDVYVRNSRRDEKSQNYEKMIIDLAVKYNINSKYTSFITVNEREEKIFDAPKYQETVLSSKFAQKLVGGAPAKMVAPVCREDVMTDSEMVFDSAPMDIPNIRPSKKPGLLGFFNMKAKESSSRDREYVREANTDLLKQKIDEYYKEFLGLDKKSILTFLLYAYYYLLKKNSMFNYNDLLNYLKECRDELVQNEEYLKLLNACYGELKNDKEREDTINLMDEKYKKIALTDMRVPVELRGLSELEAEKIIEKDKVEKNIDKVLGYLLLKIID